MAGRTVSREELDVVAKQLFKHQDFKISALKKRVTSNKWSPTTLITYYTGMRRFIATGDADLNRAPKVFYDLIKEYMNTHVSKLTPSEADRASAYTEKKRTSGPVKKIRVKSSADMFENKSPKVGSNKIEIKEETLEALKKVPEKIHTVGLLLKDGEDTIIRVFENEDVLKGFKQAFKYMDKSNELTFNEVDVTYTTRVV